ncbi:hypothetical protein UFOVP29_196 [uncultured Caudovirales phage]|uniref:Concanavalin A-like lectin/glucanases superfamily n=1 Tax=uncultured Caudovirales phage TaxID=2100421 RepID=A0A6J5KQE7_9CAUD|nr:hypothetical protein UFOVP29_196 [uncultured Caudovirales phage]
MLVDASNPRSYSGSGSTWYDLSGNSNHMTLFNNPTFTSTSPSAPCIQTDGSTQYMTCPINFTASGFTCSLMFQYLTFHTIMKSVTNGEWLQTNVNYGITLPGGTSGGGGSIYYGDLTKNICITITNDGAGNFASYVNGVFQSSISGLSYTSGTGGTQFARYSVGVSYSSINFYNITIYNRALTSNEVANNFNAIRGRYGL